MSQSVESQPQNTLVHHSLLDLEADEITVCDECGSENEIVHTGDCGYCSECHSIESYSTCYLGKDGKLYEDSEINWDIPSGSLIAAAVPMLSALEKLNAIYSDYSRDSFDLVEIRSIIKSAIAKARGES